jgi:thioesterase domain-containing protein
MMATTGSARQTAAETVTARFPATPNQERYWRESRSGPAGNALNIVYCRRLRGLVSDEAIATALQGLVDRHEILRTRFREDSGGTLMQEVLGSLRFKLDEVDLRTLDPERRQAELQRLGKAEACRPFDFSSAASEGGLFRALLIRTASDEAFIYFIFHHLVMDGWSMDLITREFGELAAAADAGSPADLPAVEMHFGDYARWQADVLAGDALAAERDYWGRQLEGLPDFRITPDRPGEASGEPSEIRSIMLPRELSDAFETLARQTDHTLFSLATAAAAAALHVFSGEPEVVLGTQVAGRDDPDSESIVGPLLNTVVLRIPVEPENDFLSFAAGVRDRGREAIAHQLLPFADLAGGSAPLYRVNLVVQRTYISSSSVKNRTYGAFRIESFPAPSTAAQWELNLFMVGREEGWRLSCEAPPALYDTATIDALLSVWKGVIEGAVADAASPIADLVPDVPPQARSRTAAAPSRAHPLPAKKGPVINPRLEALDERILTLQSKGSGTPILAINNASVLYPVAKAIGENHPFVDLHFCPSSTPIALPRRHFSDYARDAVEMIRRARPHGPYALFGLCVCGSIAIEAARILQSEGETVELVILSDTYRPGFRERMSWLDRHIRAWQVRYLSTTRLWRRTQSGELSFAQFLDNYRLFRKLGLSKLAARFGAAKGTEAPSAMTDSNRWFVEGVLLPSEADFEPEPYSGPVVLFRSEDAPVGRLFPHDFGWSRYLKGPFEVVMCPGTHDTMFRTAGAEIIGEAVRRLLSTRES